MRKQDKQRKKVEMLDEYDFSKGVRGKYASRYAQGSNVVVLEPDIFKVFNNAESVNRALKVLVDIARSQSKR